MLEVVAVAFLVIVVVVAVGGRLVAAVVVTRRCPWSRGGRGCRPGPGGGRAW